MTVAPSSSVAERIGALEAKITEQVHAVASVDTQIAQIDAAISKSDRQGKRTDGPRDGRPAAEDPGPSSWHRVRRRRKSWSVFEPIGLSLNGERQRVRGISGTDSLSRRDGRHGDAAGDSLADPVDGPDVRSGHDSSRSGGFDRRRGENATAGLIDAFTAAGATYT